MLFPDERMIQAEVYRASALCRSTMCKVSNACSLIQDKRIPGPGFYRRCEDKRVRRKATQGLGRLYEVTRFTLRLGASTLGWSALLILYFPSLLRAAADWTAF
jgi:hypothetical protein